MAETPPYCRKAYVMRKLPPDATKTALAETAALRAKVWARKNAQGLITRRTVEEAMSAVFSSPRYRSVPHPAYSTVFAAVRRMCRDDSGITLKLDVSDPENRIG